jgi:hypothetical protein
MRSIAGVPIEDQDGRARRWSRCREEPSAQAEPIARRERHLLDVGQTDFIGPRHVIRWEVNKPALPRPDNCQDRSNDENTSGRDDHRDAISRTYQQ